MKNILSAVSIALTLGISGQAMAYDGSVSIANCKPVTFTVSDFDKSSGWGAHFSTSSTSDGYGGTKAECHIIGSDSGAGVGSATLLCYDGYISNAEHTDQYRLDLGPRSMIDSLKLFVYESGVEVELAKKSTVPYNTTEKRYFSRSHFPLRDDSNFCRENTIYYSVDGTLAGRSDRMGSGYTLTVDQ